MVAGCVEANGKTYVGTYVCMGNPHFVIFVDDIKEVDLPVEGRALEMNALFPEHCNIEFAQVLENGDIRMRVWERGSGITMACGTGACATAVAAALNKKATRESNIVMDGGTLHIEWREADNHIYMTGPAARVFEGEIEL
jgi:diaminopimelate epimerase